MAVSAYDVEGRLKKHALLGTSLNVDPERKLQREQFKTLQEEALAGAGKGREFMKEKLASRWKTYEQEQTGKLEQLAARKNQFVAEEAALHDPEAEASMAAYGDYVSRGAGKGLYKWSDLFNSGIPEEVLNEAKASWDKKSTKEKVAWSKEHEHYGKDLPSAEKLYFPKYMKKYKKREPVVLGQYAKNFWEENYGPQKQEEYATKLSEAVDRINSAYTGLQEEEAGRMQKLADRMDFYNMFLGA